MCIRASGKSGGLDNINNNVNDLLSRSGCTSQKSILIIDLGYVEEAYSNTMASLCKIVLQSLHIPINEWSAVTFVAGSFPKDMSKIDKALNPNRLTRYEWMMWKEIQEDINFHGLTYGDYGTRYPYYEEADYGGTVTLKYTTEKEFVIYKGQKTELTAEGHGQYNRHAAKLIITNDFYGHSYSGGDAAISRLAKEDYMDFDNRSTGAPTQWVEYSQNHHITLLSNLVSSSS